MTRSHTPLTSLLLPAASAALVLACSGSNPDTGSDSDAATSSDSAESSGPGTTAGGESESESEGGSETGMTGEPPELDAFGFALGCYSLRDGDTWLRKTASGEQFEFAGTGPDDAARFFLKPADLGTYLLYDEEGAYLVGEDGPLLRQETLQSDLLLVDDTYVSGAEWSPETSVNDWSKYQLRNRRNDLLLGATALTDAENAAAVTFEPATGCEEHPELTLDATGEITKTTFENGDLYGIVDTHSHMMSNFGFGGGGIFHGGPFHRLGVEHALPSCEQFHGEMGRKDFFGFAFDTSGADGLDITTILPDLIAGELMQDNHITDGYPEFTEWPDAHRRSTHQAQYYRWLQRAYLSGLRLVVQHATTNSVMCHFNVGEGYQKVRYSCDDMVAVDRSIEEVYALERYIDAHAGGPGKGWFRIVFSPAEAREVIADGKLAVILGIETANLFSCTITPREGDPVCDEAYVTQQLDQYYDLGVRAIFPVHKYDNMFTPGDGDRAFIELGNFLHTSHWSNFTDQGCPDVSSTFDKGKVFFGGLNMPRDQFLSPAPLDLSAFPDAPLMTAFQFADELTSSALEGDWCQKATMTPLGETLMHELMARGMIIEVDHLPRRSYVRAYELLVEADYPAAGTHGQNNNGLIYKLGGVSKTNLGRCRDPENPGAVFDSLKGRVALIEQNGGYPAEGFGFDLNGFAGARGPRFGDGACAAPQDDPITYPFTSLAGDVEFTQPWVGNREIDFNTEGFVHIGMLPELLQDARGDADSDADFDPLLHSAEGYIRMWERAESRGAALSAKTR
ncbi:MAG: hypothetical protein H6713_42685 [Myxococcales bacterium]|nr:hypothetical protein [Myxococcales bacterium]